MILYPAIDINRDQTAGFEAAFQSFAADCVEQPDCPLGTRSAAGAATALKQLFADLDAEPVPTGETRKLGESLATIGVIAAMYDESAWPQLREALAGAKRGAFDDVDGRQQPAAAADVIVETDSVGKPGDRDTRLEVNPL